MAEVAIASNMMVVVLRGREVEALVDLVVDHAHHYEGDTELLDLARTFGYDEGDWDGLAELERTEIRDSDEERWTHE